MLASNQLPLTSVALYYSISSKTNPSDLDSQIQRPKLPNTALPDDIRKKLGFNLRRESADRQRQLLPEENEKSKTPETLKKQPFLKKGGSLSSRDQAGLNCSEEIKAKKGRKIGILTTSIAKQSITFDKKTPIN